MLESNFMPIFIFLLLMIEAVVSPFLNREVRQLSKGLEEYGKLESEGNVLGEELYADMRAALEAYRDETEEPEQAKYATEALEELDKQKELGESIIVSSMKSARKRKILFSFLANMIVTLLSNLGFILLLLTGNALLGIGVSAVTFYLVAMLGNFSVNQGMEPSDENYTQGLIVGLITTLVHHAPFLVALFVW